jgi:protoporphyrinogen oxidase
MGCEFVIIGAGPAGLSGAYELGKRGQDVVVLERDQVVGGLSRTVEHNGFRCDIGGHRFFTKIHYVDQLWHDVLGEDFLKRQRLSRIY